jgi:hypothetical protein
MPKMFTLYKIHRLAGEGGGDDEQFDTTRLPFDIAEGIRIEDVSGFVKKETFKFIEPRIGSDAAEMLRGVRFALVHRYEIDNNKFAEVEEQRKRSAELVNNIAACLRLIRPMRQSALLMHGAVREDGSFDIIHFDHPLEFHEVPEVQKVFAFRDRDADELRKYAQEFLRGMREEYWKFRMANQFYALGHFQSWQPKARYLLWASAIESIYTTHNSEHKGSLVAKERIKWFLGEHTSIYAPGDISNLLTQPQITIGMIVDDLYEVRNFIAHGDRIPDHFFLEISRRSFNGGVTKFEVLLEAASFIIRSSLLKILREGLLDHFADAAQAEAFFGGKGLTLSEIRKRKKLMGNA